MVFVCVNGKVVPDSEALFSVYDRGFLYGDGVFEVFSVFQEEFLYFEDTWERFAKSAELTLIKIPFTKQEFKENTLELLKKSKLPNARVRVVVTRGTGPKAMTAYDTEGLKSNYFILPYELILPVDEVWENGIEMVTVNAEHFMAEAKTLNFLPSIIAYLKSKEKYPKAHDVVLVTNRGGVRGAGNSNLFIVEGKQITTPSNTMLFGIGKKALKQLVESLGYEFIERDVSLHELLAADEIFIYGSGKRIVPVIKMNHKLVGNGRPGEITISLLKKFRETMH